MAETPERSSVWQRWIEPNQLGTGTLLIMIGVILTALLAAVFAVIKYGVVEADSDRPMR